MNSFVDYLNAVEPLSPSEKQLIAERLQNLPLRRGRYFQEAGKVCKYIGFVREGVLRQFNYDGEGEECTLCFVKENAFVTDMESFHGRTAATSYIVAETDCELTVFTKPDFDLFAREIPRWQPIIHRITERTLLEKAREKSLIISKDATTRYRNFAEQHPDLLLRVPLVSVASYLGMTKHSLSRVRRKLSET